MPDLSQNPYTPPSAISAVPLELEAYEEFLKDPRPLGRVFVGLMLIREASHWLCLGYPLPKEYQRAFTHGHTIYGVVLGLIYFLWIYRCSVNTQRLDRVLSPTPGIAVGGYLIPFFNLVGPYIAMKRIVAVTFRRSLKPTVGKWVLPWWFCCLTLIGTGVVEFAMNGKSGMPLFVAPLLSSLAAACLTVIVLRLSAAQAEVRVLAAGGQQQVGQSVTLRQSGVSSSELEAKAGAAGIPAKRSSLPPRRSSRR